MDPDQKRVSVVLGIFGFILVVVALLVEFDLWVPIQNIIQLEAIWILSALFLLSLIIVWVKIHHHHARRTKHKMSFLEEFMNKEKHEKITWLVFLVSFCFLIAAVLLIRSRHLVFAQWELVEEWLVVLLFLFSYGLLVVHTVTRKKS